MFPIKTSIKYESVSMDRLFNKCLPISAMCIHCDTYDNFPCLGPKNCHICGMSPKGVFQSMVSSTINSMNIFKKEAVITCVIYELNEDLRRDSLVELNLFSKTLSGNTTNCIIPYYSDGTGDSDRFYSCTSCKLFQVDIKKCFGSPVYLKVLMLRDDRSWSCYCFGGVVLRVCCIHNKVRRHFAHALFECDCVHCPEFVPDSIKFRRKFAGGCVTRLNFVLNKFSLLNLQCYQEAFNIMSLITLNDEHDCTLDCLDLRSRFYDLVGVKYFLTRDHICVYGGNMSFAAIPCFLLKHLNDPTLTFNPFSSLEPFSFEYAADGRLSIYFGNGKSTMLQLDPIEMSNTRVYFEYS